MSLQPDKREANGSGDPLAKKVKKDICFNVSSNYLAVKDELKRLFGGTSDVTIDEARIVSEPFKCVVLPNFLDDDEFLKELKKELDYDIEYNQKNNDLYRFRQSDDFKSSSLPYVTAIRQCLMNQVQPLLKDITDIELFDDVIDLTASKYSYNDTLLCHDDQLEERRIAFMLYLVPTEWTAKDGGTFDMFDRDENDQPRTITRSFSPRWNTFVFFEVTPQSYHQVAEILSQDKTRLSVNGWFRGPPTENAGVVFIETHSDVIKCGDTDIDEDVLRSWISPQFLEADTQLQVMEEFEATSEINLSGFLNDDKYQQMCQLLVDDSLEWIETGPSNRRRYHKLKIDTAPALAKELLEVFRSETMFLVMSNLSGTKFHPMAPDTSESENSGDEEEESLPKEPKIRNPRLRVELRKWSKGCYTLVHDHDPEVLDDESKLDCILHFDHDFETIRDHGGFISYIAKDADEELLTIEPQSNNLSLVYRDKDTARFVKYLTDSHVQTYYDLSLVFQQ